MNRQYSQSVARFQSADPYEASGYVTDPQSWNRYSYVQNEPLHNIDPTGLLRRSPDPPVDPCAGSTPVTEEPIYGPILLEPVIGFKTVEWKDIIVEFFGPPYFVRLQTDREACKKNSVLELTITFFFSEPGEFIRNRSYVRAADENQFKILGEPVWKVGQLGGTVKFKVQLFDIDARRYTVNLGVTAHIREYHLEVPATVKIVCP